MCIWFRFVPWVDEEFVKQEIEPMTEYAEEDKQYQTEGDEEIGTYESGSQENGKIRVEIQWIECARTKKKQKREENFTKWLMEFDLFDFSWQNWWRFWQTKTGNSSWAGYLHSLKFSV